MTVSFNKFREYFLGTGDLRDIGACRRKYYFLNSPSPQDWIDDLSYEGNIVPVLSRVQAHEYIQPPADAA